MNNSGIQEEYTMPIPKVWTQNLQIHLQNRLKYEAAKCFQTLQTPETLSEWLELRPRLLENIKKSLSVPLICKKPLRWKETGRIPLDGYCIAKIYYESRPDIWVTGNLYIPEGKGPFPAVISMHGHWHQGRLAEREQLKNHLLAKNGYVCLAVDTMGSGERSREHGKFEYHGAMLGASLMNIGETLMGILVADNMRGVDLLCSLPYVDVNRIGATGGSGGGNQTMWLSALDERIQASVPVVSVGTFESYVGGVNCICEMLPDGLCFTEESGVLALIAPRALKICNCLRDCNPTFYASEMLRSFKEARKVFLSYNADEKLSYQLFDEEHGYWADIRETMLGFFDLHLKGVGHGVPRKTPEYSALKEEDLMVFAKGKRPKCVASIASYSKNKGAKLHKRLINRKAINIGKAQHDLRKMLRIGSELEIKRVHEHYPQESWERFSIEACDGRLIPTLLHRPDNGSKNYSIFSSPVSKDELEMSCLFSEAQSAGDGIILFDLLGAGETGDEWKSNAFPPSCLYHNLSRSELWLGRTLIGEWVRDYRLMTAFAKQKLGAESVTLGGLRDAALAALFCAAIDNISQCNIKLENAPVSLLFHEDSPPKFLTMASNIPGFLIWGDIALACALTGVVCEFINPLHSDGRQLSSEELKKTYAEFRTIALASGMKGQFYQAAAFRSDIGTQMKCRK